MNIDRQTLRKATGLAAAALLAITLGTIAPSSHGAALGPVIAITPREVIPNGFVGAVLNPSLSNRGEAAGVFDSQVQQTAFVFLDTPGQEPMVPGLGLTVSGNGCVALWARNNGSTDPQASVSIGVTDRCAGGGDRVLYNTNQNYQPGGALALSFDGRYGVFREAPCFACEFDSDDLLRVDTQTGALVAVPHHGSPYFGWDPTLGVDISDDGSVITAVEQGSASAAAVVDLRDVVAWQVGTPQAGFVSGNPSQAPGAGFPSISGDGRYVAFTSNKPLAPGTTGTGPWVFINDRASNTIRLVSPGNGIAYQPSISRDASQIAYAVGPPARACQFNRQNFASLEQTCRAVRIDVAYGPGPLSTAPISTETISLGLNNAPAAGLHVEPALSGNGEFVAWISDAGNALVDPADPAFKGLRQAFVRQRDAGLAVDAVNFGTIQAGTSSQLTANVTNTGHTSVQVDSITASPAQFTIQGGGSCAGGLVLAPGTTCTVNVRYAAPNNNSTTNGIITVSESGFAAVSTTNTLVGSSSFTPPPTTSTTTTTVPGQRPPPTTTTTTTPLQISLSADPNPVDFGTVAVGIGSPIQTVTITNIGTGPGEVFTDLGGDNPQDFFVARNGCNEVTLGPNENCSMDIMMIPLAGGLRQASLILTAGGASGDVAMFGDGHFLPRLVASPESIAGDGFTTVIGLGFPPNQTFDIHIDPTDVVLTVTSDAQGQFQVPLSAVGKLSLGNYILRIDGQPDVFDTVQGQLVVALPTFEPQAPGGAVFGNAQIVTRGG